MDPKVQKVIIDVAYKHDVSPQIVALIYKESYGNVRKIFKEADQRAWPVIMMAGLGRFIPYITLKMRKYYYNETPIKLRFKYELLGGKPATPNPQGVAEHLWE